MINNYISCSEIERELREKPHVLNFMKEMLAASIEERHEATRLLAGLRQEKGGAR